MLEKSDVWDVPGAGGSPAKIGQQQHSGSRYDQDETQKKALDNKSHLRTLPKET